MHTDKRSKKVILGIGLFLCIIAVGAGLWIYSQSNQGETLSGSGSTQIAESVLESDLVLEHRDGESLSWHYEDITGQRGENGYTEILLASGNTYGKAADYLTFADEESKIAYVLAGVPSSSGSGTRGSLWRVSGEGNGKVVLIKQDITTDNSYAQYLEFNGDKYFFLNYIENEELEGKIIAFSHEGAELLSAVPGHKYALAEGSIECVDIYCAKVREFYCIRDLSFRANDHSGSRRKIYIGR